MKEFKGWPELLWVVEELDVDVVRKYKNREALDYQQYIERTIEIIEMAYIRNKAYIRQNQPFESLQHIIFTYHIYKFPQKTRFLCELVRFYKVIYIYIYIYICSAYQNITQAHTLFYSSSSI